MNNEGIFSLFKGMKFLYEYRQGVYIKIKYRGEIEKRKVKYEFKNLDNIKGIGPKRIRISRGSWRLKKLKKI